MRTAAAVQTLLALLLLLPGAAYAAGGTVKFYKEAKGFGLIQPDAGGGDVWVGAEELKHQGLRSLQAGQRVSYELRIGGRSIEAANLELAGDVPENPAQPVSPPSELPQSPAPAAEPEGTSAAPAEQVSGDSMASDQNAADDDTGAPDEDSAAEEESDDPEEGGDEEGERSP